MYIQSGLTLNPSMALLEIFKSKSNIGIIMGKLSIAIRVLLLLAFDAMLETMVSVEENPIAPNNMVIKNRLLFTTGLPSTIV